MPSRKQSTPVSAKSEEPTKEDATTGAESPQRTASTSHKATSVWKSVLGATGSWCERATLYRETRRLPNGYRVDIPPSERISYGTAVDRAHEFLMTRRYKNGPVDMWACQDDRGAVEAEADAATRAGIEQARSRRTEEPVTDEEWSLMEGSVHLCVEKLLGLYPNRVKAGKRGVVDEKASEGDPPGPPITWIPVKGSDDERISTQGFDGKVLRTAAVGGISIAGKPDYLWVDDQGIVLGWWDIKTGKRGRSFPAQWADAEVVSYDLMCAEVNGGVLPEFHGYMEYHRTVKPFWSINTAEVHPSTITLAHQYMRRWGVALDEPDELSVSFSVSMCGKCEWREPNPRVGHPGCEVGLAVADVAPKEEPADGA